MDKIKLAQRTIALLSSMIESGECHTSRSREMKDNALNGLEQLRLGAVVGQSEQLVAFLEFVEGYKMLEVDLEYEEIVRRFLGN